MKKTLFFSPSCSDFLLFMGTKGIKYIKWAYDRLANLVIMLLLAAILITLCRIDPVINLTEKHMAADETVKTEAVPEDMELSPVLSALTDELCDLYDVDKDLVYAVMSTADYDPTHNSMAEDGIPRYGLMSIHPDLIGKSKTQFDWRLDVVESSYSNLAYGVYRLAWALSDNESLEGALMSYYYTKPVALEMWKQGIKTTDWVEEVKGEL